MSVVMAFAWGAFSSASLYIGEALAGPMEKWTRATGMIMGFGAGTLLVTVAYELIPETNLGHGTNERAMRLGQPLPPSRLSLILAVGIAIVAVVAAIVAAFGSAK
jgi:zinc transporter ZupT